MRDDMNEFPEQVAGQLNETDRKKCVIKWAKTWAEKREQ